MGALLTLLIRTLASVGIGYVANDVVDIVQENATLKKEAKGTNQAVPPIMFQNLLVRWQVKSFLIKFGIIVGSLVVLLILLMSKVNRRKLLR